MSSTSWKQIQTNELPLITISDPSRHSHFFHSHLSVVLYSSRLSLIYLLQCLFPFIFVPILLLFSLLVKMSYFLFCLKHFLFMAFVSLFGLGFGLFSVFPYLAFVLLVNCKVCLDNGN
ncbi:hypothetical protein ACB094_01G220000 [Castanea mollissima]